jgi:hypothetical protein
MLRYCCLICKNEICLKCWEIHVSPADCNPQKVENVIAIKDNCKHCPRCRVPIYRTEGCDHMFCIRCKTLFNWSNGTVVSDLTWFHNPHMNQNIVRPPTQQLIHFNPNRIYDFYWIKVSNGVVFRKPMVITSQTSI